MAIQFINPGDGLYRQTGLVPVSSDFTSIIRFKPLSNIAGTDYRNVMSYINAAPGPATAYTRFAGVFGSLISAQQRYYVEAFDGVTDTKSTPKLLTAGTEYRLAYVRQGSIFHIFLGSSIEGTLIDYVGTFSLDLAGVTWNSAVIGGDGFIGAGSSVTNINMSYYREWSAALKLNEIFTEWNSSKAYRTTNLVADTPLETDGNDISGNSNHWVLIAGAATFISGSPLGSTVDISAGPFPYARVVTQAEFNASNAFWFKYTTAVKTALGFFVNKGGTFTPDTFVYLGDSNSLWMPNAVTPDTPFYHLVGPGTYYIKVLRQGGGASNFDFTFAANIHTIDFNATTVAINSVLVNDDTAGYPATVWNINGNLVGFLLQIPASELGVTLPTGESLWHDRFSNYESPTSPKLAIFDRNFNYITSLDTTPSVFSSATACSICCNQTDFYVSNNTTEKLYKVTKAGVITDTGATLATGGNVNAIAVSNDGTTCLYVDASDRTKIKSWNIAGNSANSTFYTVPALLGGHTGQIAQSALGNNGEIIALADGNFVTWYLDGTTDTSEIIYLSNTGTLLHQWSFLGAGENFGTGKGIDHINPTSSPTVINVWFFTDNFESIGNFKTIDLTTGLSASGFTDNLFTTGQSQVDGVNQIFGPSQSCVMVTTASKQSGGIYKIVKDKRQDTLWVTFSPPTTQDVKIPDPQFKTALLGD